MKMNIDLQLGQEDLEKKKRFYEDQQNINSKLERDIDSLDQAISELSVKLTKEEANRVQFQDEVFRLILQKYSKT
jgi:septal ring factor EnvC (AmiA/AmiB activator)